MKLTYKNTESFLKKPDPKIKAVLIYGPDEGLARERIGILGKTVVDDLNDPFNVIELNGDQINDTPTILSDEVFAISMMGGRRLIRIRNANDKNTKVLESLMQEAEKIDNLILIHGGDLTPKSSLRKWAEKSKSAAALPCYVEDERDVSRFLSNFFSQHQLRIDADALNLASSILSGDRALIRQEAEKIITYKGEDHSTITLNDITACLGATNAETLDVLVQHMASGRGKQMEETLSFLFSEGASAVMILRVVQNYFRRLYITHGRMQDMGFEQAIAKLYPPVFFKHKPGFQQHLKIWSKQRTEGALHQLYEAEALLKSGALDADLICNRTLLSLCALASKRR